MPSSTKRLFVLGALALAAIAIYFIVRGRAPAATPTTAQPPARIEQPAAPATPPRPLDSDFKAAMERDSQAAARESGSAP